MKRSLIITGLILATYILPAQYAEDALRYSQYYYQGTARNMAVGGAFGALGGDFSALATNPGSIAIYRSSELIGSVGFTPRKVTSVYNGTMADNNSFVMALNNFGYINASRIGRGGKGWKYWQFAVGMNRLNNFNTNTFTQGINTSSSRIDAYLNDALDYLGNGGDLDNLTNYDPFFIGPAWQTYLLDTIGDENNIYLVSPVPPGGLMQQQSVETHGSTNEWFASAGANFNDVLYIGATLGLPYIRYYRETFYRESDFADTIATFNSWSVTENLHTRGMGVNFKLGVIVRPIDWIRIGAAFHTPTYYFGLRDTWSTYTVADIYAISADEFGVYDYQSVTGDYKYKITTPMRFIGDLAFVIKDFGFISGEYEYVDYGTSKFKAKDYDFAYENQDIKDYFRATHNFRVGTEWRISRMYIRGGYALYASPYKNGLNDGSRQSYSGGLGYKGDGFALDLAYVYSKSKEDYYLYSFEGMTPSVNELKESSIVVTFRYQF